MATHQVRAWPTILKIIFHSFLCVRVDLLVLSAGALPQPRGNEVVVVVVKEGMTDDDAVVQNDIAAFVISSVHVRISSI
jgi:hypothetical protein